jgi:hypothetical protein
MRGTTPTLRSLALFRRPPRCRGCGGYHPHRPDQYLSVVALAFLRSVVYGMGITLVLSMLVAVALWQLGWG